MPAYEETIKEMAAYIRNELQQLEDVSSLDFNIMINGRVHDSELRITFEIGSTYSKGGVVRGGSVDTILREYMRRFGWDLKHQPLMLSYSATNEETPF